ncbi:uncharacterized protein EV422DRAFT_123790 [Fimicolochytrium jonesii]|uniref:uncharacterized protein n=1 Tax=Fimicolochytrium jonesii TaxID=1396493 RepID=UPI0022FE4008|nr:uncharacterized protein EV422DRAFT_123790 [Fimicolochytrium jonesii]KAI8818880.1 hypothetical protein EV422DRAFT_123790 [Fimicolochytrium jonesii]
MYIVSNDYGRAFNTWKKPQIGVTGGTPTFRVDDTNVDIDTIGIDQVLMDTEGTPVVAYKTGLPYTSTSYVPPISSLCSTNWANDRIAKGQSYLVPRMAGGFNKTAIPFPINSWSTSHLVLDSSDNAYVIINDLPVVRGTAASTWTSWELLADFGQEVGNTG